MAKSIELRGFMELSELFRERGWNTPHEVAVPDTMTGPELLALISRQQPANPATYSTVGAGSQILRDLGVRKMRLMSSPMKFNAISGFDLEVVEYLPAD